MRRNLLLLALAGVSLSACTRELTPRDKLVQAEIVKDRVTQWSKALNNKSLDTLFSMYRHVPELMVTTPIGLLNEGWEAEEQSLRNLYRTIDFMNFVVQSPKITILSKDVAVVVFGHSTTLITGGSRSISAGRGTLVWVKDPDDGLWKIQYEHISRNPGSG